MTQLTFDKCQLCHTLFKSHKRQPVVVDLFNILKVTNLQLKRQYDKAQPNKLSAK